ncbi:DNA-binding protein HU family [Pseudomonas syringae pv. maculicola]|nr:DNA-binding protein HU family [Pseudomonas syringae pv. maculicola]
MLPLFTSGAGHKNKKPLKRLHMRKPDVAAAIAEKADLTKEQSNRVLNAILEEITGALHRKDSVTLVGFGTFLQRHRGARTGKNPQTGEPVKIKASNTVAFKPGKALKDSVNP